MLEDVAPAEQGDQMRGCSPADIEAAIDELVLLHGPRWGDPTLLDIEWLQPLDAATSSADGRAASSWPSCRSASTTPTASTPTRWRSSTGSCRGSPTTCRHRPQPWTIVHGDFRADNLLFGGDRVVVVDWQTVDSGPGPATSPTCSAPACCPEVRREARGRARRPLRRRAARPRASTVERDDVWTLYRRYAFSGLVMAIVASVLVRRTDRGDEMFMTMADRHARQALDLDSESLLG